MQTKRKYIVAGNWKMNTIKSEALALFNAINTIKTTNVEIILAPPAIYLDDFGSQKKQLKLAAQNSSYAESGAYTGEISASMLAAIQTDYCLVGHSERRMYFGETNQQLKQKIDILLKNNIAPIFCCGESLEERNNSNQQIVIKKQLQESVFHLSEDQFHKCVIAYEPIWAIGTGLTATPHQAQEMHQYIRSLVSENYSEQAAQNTTILYGGSCNATNASQIFNNKDVDGGLIGGAALQFDTFKTIIEILEILKN